MPLLCWEQQPWAVVRTSTSFQRENGSSAPASGIASQWDPVRTEPALGSDPSHRPKMLPMGSSLCPSTERRHTAQLIRQHNIAVVKRNQWCRRDRQAGGIAIRESPGPFSYLIVSPMSVMRPLTYLCLICIGSERAAVIIAFSN